MRHVKRADCDIRHVCSFTRLSRTIPHLDKGHLVNRATGAVLDEIHEPAHDLNAESTCTPVLSQVKNVGLGVLLGVECASFVTDANDEALVFDDYGEIDRMRSIPLIRVFDNVRTRLIDGYLEFLDCSVREFRLTGVLRNKSSHLCQVAC